MADQDEVGQILIVDDAEHILDMGAEIDVAVEQMLALAQPGQRRRVDFVPRLTQRPRHWPPQEAAAPGAVNQNECRHITSLQ